MRVNKGPVAESFEGFVTDMSTDPVLVDFRHTVDQSQFVDSSLAVPRSVFVCSTGVDCLPDGHSLSVSSRVDRTAVYLELGQNTTTPRFFRGFLPLDVLPRLESTDV